MKHTPVRTLTRALATSASLVIAASSAAAQATGTTPVHPIEFGIDAGVLFGLDSPSSTTITIPAQSVRVGFFVNDRFSLEPAFGLTSSSSGGTNSTSYRLEVGGLWHFAGIQQGLYVRPFVGFRGNHFSEDNISSSATQALLGVGGGWKYPINRRVSARFEANYEHDFDGGDSGSSNGIGLRAGLSFFTR
jgi:hypothetical protein